MHLKVVEYNTIYPGTTLVLMGSVHGDEKCGSVAISRLMQTLDESRLQLTKGTLIGSVKIQPRANEPGLIHLF